MLTLLGPGGSGKTRLALETAAGQLDNYSHGVWFASLAPLQSVDAIVPTVAEALGFRFYEEGDPRQQLLNYLRQKTLLLIMDNYEHLLTGAGLVTEILKTAPGVKVLATSRTRLNVGGEHRFQIAGMDFPESTPKASADAIQYSAVKLFLQGARRAQPDFELTGENLGGVIDVCRVVEGLPLAIRLAAAWVAMLSPREIAAEISRGIDFLETDLRDVPERQRSMRAVFDHSWKLLAEREREVFQGLSVFRGGFTRDAAQEVSGALLRELMTLVNKSLLHRTSTGRYEVHELLRQCAAEKLDGLPATSEAVHDRHSAYYTVALQQWDTDLKGPRQQATMAEMDVEIENAREAWNWAAKRGQVERLDQAVEGLCRFYAWRTHHQEVEAACRMAMESLSPTAFGDELRVLAKILVWQGLFLEDEFASQLLKQSLALLEKSDPADENTQLEKAFVLERMGDVARGFDHEKARHLYEQSLALYQVLGDRWGTANVLSSLGAVAWNLGAYDKAKRLNEESLVIRRAMGDPRGITSSLSGLGWIALHQGQLKEGEHLVRESIAVCQEMGDQASTAAGLLDLGGTFLFRGKFAEADALYQESMAVYNDLGWRSCTAFLNTMLGITRWHLGQYKGAHAQGQKGLALAREIGSRRGIAFSLHVLGCVALAGEEYAEAQCLLQESVSVFQEIGHTGWIGEALAVLAYAALKLGQLIQTQQLVSEALQTVTEVGVFLPRMYALPAIALFLADQGKKERAVELYALASRYPFVANSRWFEDVAGKHIAAVAATLPPEVVKVAQGRGRTRDLDATVAELLVKLKQ